MKEVKGMKNRIWNEDIDAIIKVPLPWEKLQNLNILITGATGYLMVYLVYTLLRLNEGMRGLNIGIFCLCRSVEKVLVKYKDVLGRKDLHFIYGDVCEEWESEQKMDIIIHAASPANPYAWSVQPINTLTTNIFGTRSMLEYARKHNVIRCMYFSSSSVYGKRECTDKLSESNTGEFSFTDCRYCYGVGKGASELLCKSYIQEFGIDIVMVRPFIIYGPGMDISMKKAFTDFLFATLEGKNIIVKSNGSAVRSYCYIADAIKAIFTVLLTGKSGEVYNIANSREDISIKQLAETFLKIGGNNTNICYEMSGEGERYLNTICDCLSADTSKIEKLGWKADIDLEEGIYRTLESYK